MAPPYHRILSHESDSFVVRRNTRLECDYYPLPSKTHFAINMLYYRFIFVASFMAYQIIQNT